MGSNRYSWPLRGPGDGLRLSRGRGAGGTVGPSLLRQLPWLAQGTARTHPGPLPRLRDRGHKGISTFSLGPPAQRASVTHLVKAAGVFLVQCQYCSTPGHWGGWSLLLPPLNMNCPGWTHYRFLAPRAWGRAFASRALTRNSARPRGAKRAPQSPRQVREGYVDFILPWRTGGPKKRPFFALCILF